MKLKRILSLALSGVLAVSMLTACGFGGNGTDIFRPGNQSASFARVLNGKQDMLDYGTSDSKLSDAIYTVVRSMDADDVVTSGAVTGDIATTVKTLTGYGDLNSGSAWQAQDESGTYVKVYVYDANNDLYNTLDEVATIVKDDLAPMDLNSDAAKANAGFTNAYEGNVAVYSVSFPAANSGDEDTKAWVIGVSIEQTATAKK